MSDASNISVPPPTNGASKDSDDVVPRNPMIRPPLGLSQLAIVIAYPTTLLAASLFYTLSPSDASERSYFSQKTNLFNTFFVKNAWLWTSFAYAFHVLRLRPSLRLQAGIRWVLATFWWIVITQWFFGPPIMDRAFLWTGGKCQQLQDEGMEMSRGELFVTSAACKAAGGKWGGGHDLSGHVFLLTHASLFLWAEMEPVVSKMGWKGLANMIVAGIMGLWWWMLLMTGVYFHTAFEKLTGLILAMVEWAVIYGYALRVNPSARAILGTPSV